MKAKDLKNDIRIFILIFFIGYIVHSINSLVRGYADPHMTDLKFAFFTSLFVTVLTTPARRRDWSQKNEEDETKDD